MTADEDRDPWSALERLFSRAKKIEPVDVEVISGDDPVQRIRQWMERARREERGQGGAALRRLRERIDEARQIPDPSPYRHESGDPLDVLQARMRGELPSGEEPPAKPGGGDGSTRGRKSRQHLLGESLEKTLKGRPLPGPVRVAVAIRLAALMERSQSDELEEIWELVVFGASELGSITDEQ